MAHKQVQHMPGCKHAEAGSIRSYHSSAVNSTGGADYSVHHGTEIVVLNVSGTKFETLYETIARVRSTFFQHFVRIDQRSGKVIRLNSKILNDGTGGIFINRDAHLFTYVLQFMRDGKRAVFPKEETILRQIMRESEFFGMDDLRLMMSDMLMEAHSTRNDNLQMLENLDAQVKQIAQSIAYTSFSQH